MRLVFLLPGLGFACIPFVACGSSSDPAGPAPVDGGLPDRSTTTDAGGGTDTGSAFDAGQDVSTCVIGADETVSGTIKVSVDDQFKLYVNGTNVKEFTGTWDNVQTVGITLNRHPSKKNVIAVEGVNTAKISGLDRMIVAELTYMAGGTGFTVSTDDTWKQSATLTTGWMDVAFGETGFAAAVVEGTNGDAPYGQILGAASTAKYLWSYDAAAVDVGTKPDQETVYFRKTFYLDLAGAPQAAPVACP